MAGKIEGNVDYPGLVEMNLIVGGGSAPTFILIHSAVLARNTNGGAFPY